VAYSSLRRVGVCGVAESASGGGIGGKVSCRRVVSCRVVVVVSPGVALAGVGHTDR